MSLLRSEAGGRYRPARRDGRTCHEAARHSGEARCVSDGLGSGFRLHPLKGELRGFWAVTVRANRRVIFRFVDPDIFDVDYVDYH